MSEPDEALRRLVAAEYGLDSKAARFLVGSSLEELEVSAGVLAKLLATESDRQREQFDPLTHALASAGRAEKQWRQRALLNSLHGRPPRLRDERGRFRGAVGFDGGARQPLPLPRDPMREHGELVGQLLALRRLFAE